MTKITATLDDYSSLDGKSVHRSVSVTIEHQQVRIRSDNKEIMISRDALRQIERLSNV
jgi:hypothetical protein